MNPVTSIMAAIVSMIGYTPSMLYAGQRLLGGNAMILDSDKADDIYTDLVPTSRGFARLTDGTSKVSYFDPLVPTSSVALDANGWPTENFCLFVASGMPLRPDTAGAHQGSFYSTAPVTISIEFGAPNDTVTDVVRNVGTGITTFTYNLSSVGANHALTFMGVPGTSFRDLKIIRPGYPADGSTKFTVNAVNTFSRLEILRTLDMVRCNFNLTEISWAQRMPSWKKAGRGNWEQAIEICNAFGLDLWVNIPPGANDDYFQQLANLLSNNLLPQLKVFPEYANEAWNSGFPVYNYSINQVEVELGAYSNSSSISGAVSKITAISRTGNVVTVTHNGYQQPGANIFVYAAHDASLRTTFGTNPAVTIISPTQFSYPSTGADIASTAGLGFEAFTKNLGSVLMQGTGYRAAGVSNSILNVREFWVMRRAKTMSDIFKATLGSRAKVVYSMQLGNESNNSPSRAALQWLNQNYGAPSTYLDGYAGGLYVSPGNLAAANADATGLTGINDAIARIATQYSTRMHYFVGIAKLYGLTPMWYECGLDTDTQVFNDTVAQAIHRHPQCRTFMKSMFDYSYSWGVRQMCLYGATVQHMAAGVIAGQYHKNSWYWAENPSQVGPIGSATSYKIQGFDDTRAAIPPQPAGKYLAPCVVPANDMQEAANGNHFASQNGFFWGASATTGDYLITVPADGDYNIIVKGGNSVASTVGVLVDGVFAGTANLPAVTLSAGTVFGDSQTIAVTMAKGNHIVRLLAETGTRYLKSFSVAAV